MDWIEAISKLGMSAVLCSIIITWYKVHSLKMQRYKGRNPKHCPNCSSKKCQFSSAYRDKSEQLIEVWGCPKCGKITQYFII